MNFSDLETRDINRDGVRLRCRIGGEGPILVLLHGSPQMSLAWRKLVPALSRSYQLVIPDLRGYGDSGKPESGYGLQDYADDLKHVLDNLGSSSINVVGHDLGGIVAYVFAAQHPARVRRLGVIEAPIIGVPSPTMERVLASYGHISFYNHPRLPELLIEGREREYLAEFIRTYQYVDGVEREALDHYASNMFSLEGLRGMLGIYRALIHAPPLLDELTKSKLQMPIWAVGGDHSMGMGPFEQFEHLAEQVTGGVIPDCGHWVAEEKPGRVESDLLRFLR